MPRSATDLKPRILAEARRLLVTEGHGALSTRRIAREVGCTAPSIYLYFANKDALVHALVDEGFQLLRAHLEAAHAEAAARPGRSVEALCQAYADFALANPEYYEVMFHLGPAELSRYPKERYRVQRAVLDLIGRAALGPGAGPERTLRTATLIWSSLHGAISLHLAHRIDKSVRGPELLADAVRVAVQAARLEPTLRTE
ncbi:MAG: TetR/AcrR family transcriptional regulator [Planctomycetes bacterium]|nr:TetR/AcrR family transcriptional regulator [Planctomycetota bacterium]MDA0947336.1 TetR/AcrR family transcriptional regulator [Planctomycetota bacterium]